MIRSVTLILSSRIPKQSLLRQLSSQSTQKHEPSKEPAYRYTLDGSKFTPEERNSYETNGFLLFKRLIPKADIERYTERFRECASGSRKPESPELLLMKEVSQKDSELSESSLYKINELYADEVLFEYCTHPSILEYVEGITGPDIMSISSMLINKPPDTGSKSSRHPLHQDLHYFPMRPADRIVGAWTAMEKVTPENGCLVVVPGSHRQELMSHDYPEWEGGVNKFYHGANVSGEVIEKRVHMSMEPGDTLFIHPLLLHGSGTNKTKGPRKAICSHFVPADIDFIDVTGTIQEKSAEEVMKIYNPKFMKMAGITIDYATLWKIRGRTVQGEKGWDVDI